MQWSEYKEDLRDGLKPIYVCQSCGVNYMAGTLHACAKRSSILSNDPADRKAAPLARGLLDYFPRALTEVARISQAGNDQHNPGEPLHWAREKSTDHADCIMRHLIDRGTRDTDGRAHSGKVAWRALAMLELELEEEEMK